MRVSNVADKELKRLQEKSNDTTINNQGNKKKTQIKIDRTIHIINDESAQRTNQTEEKFLKEKVARDQFNKTNTGIQILYYSY